jgi:hypothetical protein
MHLLISTTKGLCRLTVGVLLRIFLTDFKNMHTHTHTQPHSSLRQPNVSLVPTYQAAKTKIENLPRVVLGVATFNLALILIL